MRKQLLQRMTYLLTMMVSISWKVLLPQPCRLNQDLVKRWSCCNEQKRNTIRIKRQINRIDPETSSTFLENECYKKYGKTGKSFYLSQVATTVRWLSTTNATDFYSKVVTTSQSPNLQNVTEVETSSPSPSVSDQETKMMNEKDPGNVASSPLQTTYRDIKLPHIPSSPSRQQ